MSMMFGGDVDFLTERDGVHYFISSSGEYYRDDGFAKDLVEDDEERQMLDDFIETN